MNVLSATYRDSRRPSALQACLSLRKLNKTSLSSSDPKLDLPPSPLDIPRPIGTTPFANDIHITDPDNHRSKIRKITNDPLKIAEAKERAICDAQELIGELLTPATPNPSYPYHPVPSSPSIPPQFPIPSPSKTPYLPIPKMKQIQEPAMATFKITVPSPTIETSTQPMEPPSDPVAYVPVAIHPAPSPPPPLDLVRVIKEILAQPLPCPAATQFAFQLDTKSANHNTNILASYQYDLDAAIYADKNSPLQCGSEFRPPSILAPLLAHHPNWHKITSILDNGSSFHSAPLTESNRLLALEAALSFGNHKGATNDPAQLHALLVEDVIHGFNLPLNMSAVRKIPGLVLSPMNIARQNTIDETGQVMEKDRLTHDHSYDYFPNSSINSRCDLTLHEPCMFGRAMSRLIHWIVYLRTKYPTHRLLMTKTDWKAAYRRGHLNMATAIQCATQMDNILLVPLRMTFGGAPCPSEWSCISDTGSDIATDIANTPNWDATQLVSPHQYRLPPVPDCDPARPPPQTALVRFPTRGCRPAVQVRQLH
jgi:hypothetical protein